MILFIVYSNSYHLSPSSYCDNL